MNKYNGAIFEILVIQIQVGKHHKKQFTLPTSTLQKILLRGWNCNAFKCFQNTQLIYHVIKGFFPFIS